jgi:hypothetical protein
MTMSQNGQKRACTHTCRRAGALVALPMRGEIPNAVVDHSSPSNNGTAFVALPYMGRVANAVIVHHLPCYSCKELSIDSEAN